VEVVVSDGGSTDETVSTARACHPDVLVVTGSPGRGQQLNRGALKASGDRLLFLHADCILPKFWSRLVTRALDEPATTLACFRLRTEPVDRSRPTTISRLFLGILDLRSRGPFLPYGDQGIAVRRETFTGLGGFPDIPLMEDFSFARRCRRRGRVVRLPAEVRTTARRYERQPVRALAILATFPTLFKLGVSPDTLARWYGVVR
jgi:glycosyltransferase involved in cell wall biosynthesis